MGIQGKWSFAHLLPLLVQAMVHMEIVPVAMVNVKRWRAKCPGSFTADSALACLHEAKDGLASKIDAAKAGGHVFCYNFGLAGPDRQALHEYQNTIKIFLMKNSSGIFKKSDMAQAFQQWNASVDYIFTKNRPKHYLNDQVYALVSMFHALKVIKKGVRKGSRLPRWLMDLVMMLDVTQGVEENNTSSESETHDVDLEEEETTPKSDVLAATTTAPLTMHQLKSEFYKTTPQRNRPLLRRVSTASSSADPQPHICLGAPAAPIPIKDPPEPMKKKDTFWYDPIELCAKRLDPEGMVTSSTGVEMHSTGFALFQWGDGKKWLSEEPYLGLQPLEPVMKKPSHETLETKDKTGDMDYKIIFSRAYHKAEREYNKECKINNEPVDVEKRRRLCRAAGKAATEALQS